MRIQLLGTGSADGWPNPWCTCAGCADHRTLGLLRTPTSAVVDGRLLLDCGPEAPRQALRAGVSLAGVEAVALGHGHHDHTDPAFLLYRSWVTDSSLRVIGPEPVIRQCTPWLEARPRGVQLETVTAGDRVAVGALRLTVLPAAHHAFGEAVLYLVDDGQARLLYATDTGPLPRAAQEALAGSRLDVVLLEETFGLKDDHGTEHHDLVAFGDTVATLRRIGAVTAATRVVAVHLSHHNPPLAELQRVLASWGAECLPDGATIKV